MSIEDRLRESLRPLVSTEPPPDVVNRATSDLPRRAHPRMSGSVGTAVAFVALLIVMGVAAISLPRPELAPGSTTQPDATFPAVAAGASPSAPPTLAVVTPTPPIAPTQTPRADATPMPNEAVREFTNPDGPDPADYPSDGYPFIEMAYGLPTFGQLWIDENQRDVHVAVTGDIDGAIEELRDGIPRDITVYFHIVEQTQAEICALRDAIFDDREELMRHGIVLTSGGCGNMEHRVNVGMSPLTPETIAYMRARYDGPIDYEHGGSSWLRPYDPPEVADVRLRAVRSGDLDLLTCGRRPFPTAALENAPGDINETDPEYGALRDALSIYVDVYGDLSGLGWILAEKNVYGATFIADRGDTWLEAPVFAGTGGWAPGTIDYCSPHQLTLNEGGTASVYFDPAFPKPTADATEIHVLVEEQGCSGASSPASRLLPPTVAYEDDSVTLTVRVRSVGGFATCPGNPALPVTIELPEPLGNRALEGVSPRPKY